MKDIINSIKVHLHERSTSPLFGAFAFSWIGWNYKFILALFSDYKLADKILFIDNVLYPNFLYNIGYGFVIPVATAAAFIYAYPYPAKKIFTHWKTKQKELNEEKQKIEKETLLSVEDSQKIRQEINQIETANFEALQAKDKKYEVLEKLISSKDEEIEAAHLINEKLEDGLKEKTKEINKLDQEVVDLQSELDKLEQQSHIRPTGEPSSKGFFVKGDVATPKTPAAKAMETLLKPEKIFDALNKKTNVKLTDDKPVDQIISNKKKNGDNELTNDESVMPYGFYLSDDEVAILDPKLEENIENILSSYLADIIDKDDLRISTRIHLFLDKSVNQKQANILLDIFLKNNYIEYSDDGLTIKISDKGRNFLKRTQGIG